jgi:hypothetical protein
LLHHGITLVQSPQPAPLAEDQRPALLRHLRSPSFIKQIHSDLLLKEDKMKASFHEVELGQAVLQNSTAIGTEQLIVTLKPESHASIRFQIKQNTNESSSTVSSIAIDQQGLQKLVQWLREEGAVQ